MTFPHYFHLFGYTLHPHPVMECLAYLTGFSLNTLIKVRRRELTTPTAFNANLWITVGALFGALAGAKLLALAESPLDYAQQAAELGLVAFLGGKTIVGGLLGGWLGVEIAKKCTRTSRSTGDAWVLPLCASIAIGRIGCFLTGLPDHTYGNPSSLPWAVDFGDHIPRHPTQLYEIAFVLLLAGPLLLLNRRSHPPHPPGMIFRLFILAYCAFRFAIEFIKPTYKPYLGLSAIQLTCLTACIFCVYSLSRLRPNGAPCPTAPTSSTN